MGKCPNCGAPMQGNSCLYCHYVEPEEQNNVSKKVVINNIYSQPQESNFNVRYLPNISPKSKTVALLLCIFLGYFGAHKFYVGKTGMGILYFFTIGGIIWVGLKINF